MILTPPPPCPRGWHPPWPCPRPGLPLPPGQPDPSLQLLVGGAAVCLMSPTQLGLWTPPWHSGHPGGGLLLS